MLEQALRVPAFAAGQALTSPAHWAQSFIGMQVVGKDAKSVRDTLASQHGIMVRHYNKKRLDGFVRISVGKPEHTDLLIAVLQGMA